MLLFVLLAAELRLAWSGADSKGGFPTITPTGSFNRWFSLASKKHEWCKVTPANGGKSFTLMRISSGSSASHRETQAERRQFDCTGLQVDPMDFGKELGKDLNGRPSPLISTPPMQR